MPDGNVDRIDTVSNASEDTGDGHLNLFGSSGLEDGADNHDPASPSDTTLTTPSIGRHESKKCAEEAAQIVERSDNAFEDGVWVVEFISEGWETDDGTQDTLIITEKLEQRTN